MVVATIDMFARGAGYDHYNVYDDRGDCVCDGDRRRVCVFVMVQCLVGFMTILVLEWRRLRRGGHRR
eukprot:537040-Lingulodinium_polyedra.AAC.1